MKTYNTISAKQRGKQDRTLSRLRQLWRKYPQMRLPQLLVNVINCDEACPGIFYCEDSALLARVNHVLEHGFGSKLPEEAE